MNAAPNAMASEAPVLTITLNPALDLATRTEAVEPAHKLRCEPPLRHPGGGGLNVARALHRLGHPVLALYLAGGMTGDSLGQLLSLQGVPARRIPIAGETRTSFAVVESAGEGREFRFVLPGPALQDDEWLATRTAVASQASPGGLVVLSGSLPPGSPDDAYAQLADLASTAGSRVALDSSGPALAAALAGGCVDLVKPSLRELGSLVDAPLDTEARWAMACRSLIEQGRARRVALSLGERGALLASANGCWRADALKVPVASSSGAGDSFLAGLCAARLRGDNEPEMLRKAVAAASAALLRPGTALCEPDDVARLAPQVQVRRL